MPHTLLLADDSVTIQRVIELTFADEDVQVVAVSDGDQAIARIEANPPDIILADVGMPGKNGYEVAQYVKTSSHLAHIPVVLLTGAFEPVDQARATEMGCEGVLAKPFEPQLVIGRVKELLGRSSGPSTVPAMAGTAAASPSPSLADALFGRTAAAVPSAPVPPKADLNNYFDRLDKAFADLTSPAVPAPAPADIDWFKTAKPEAPVAVEQWDIGGSLTQPSAAEPLVASPAPVAPVFEPQADSALAAAPTPRPIETASAPFAASPAAAGPLPPLADAFAALLAAEQKAGVPAGAPQWPTAPAAAAAAPVPAEITEDVIEDVVRRVLARMSDAVVRERVGAMVSDIAERLVSEEIERIKRSVS